MRKKKKIKSTLVAVLALVMVMGITTQAKIAITQTQKLQLVGTSSSVWKNVAKGNRTNSSIKDSLYSGIKGPGDSAPRFGRPVGGNKVYLTAYSPALAGKKSKLKGAAMVYPK